MEESPLGALRLVMAMVRIYNVLRVLSLMESFFNSVSKYLCGLAVAFRFSGEHE